MEIKKGTICLLLNEEIGKIREEDSSDVPILNLTKPVRIATVIGINDRKEQFLPYIVRTTDKTLTAEGGLINKINCNRDMLIPLFQNPGFKEINDWNIENLLLGAVLIIQDLQKQNRDLESRIESLAKSLIKTQEKIREHTLGPHPRYAESHV